MPIDRHNLRPAGEGHSPIIETGKREEKRHFRAQTIRTWRHEELDIQGGRVQFPSAALGLNSEGPTSLLARAPRGESGVSNQKKRCWRVKPLGEKVRLPLLRPPSSRLAQLWSWLPRGFPRKPKCLPRPATLQAAARTRWVERCGVLSPAEPG
jgi:hypothetical protein